MIMTKEEKSTTLVARLKRWLANYIVQFIKYLDKDGKVLEVDKEQPIWIRVYYKITGKIYYWTQQLREGFRVSSFKFVRKLSSLNIAKEIVWHTRDLIFLLVILIFSGLAFYFFQQIEFYLPVSALENILIAYSSGLAALLGIIFALYSVGFQTTTEKFSSEVVDYLNSEQVGRFFFKLLTFSTLFSLSNLVLQYGADTPIYLLFIFSSALVAISVLGILIFKDDYVTKLKPKQVFQRLQKENIEAIKRVNRYDSPFVKDFRLDFRENVRSFKLYLNPLNSWSIVQTSYENTRRRLKIYETLYYDLIREQKYEDASFGLMRLGYFLAEYISIKHFIETDFAWWFPQYQELVKADSPDMIPMKLNYEAQGIGKLSISKNNYLWLEDEILVFLKKIQDDTEQAKNPLIANALMSAYKIMLYGSYSKTKNGYEKFLFGVFENQDFELAEKIIKQFVALGHIVKDMEECRGNYVNAFGQIKTVIMDGFARRHFPGKLTDWKPRFKRRLRSLIQDRELIVSKGDIASWKEPQYLHSLILDVFNKLKVEQQAEGNVITPKKWFVNKLTKEAQKEEKNQVEKLRRLLIDSSIELMKADEKGFYKNYFAGILLSWFNQLIDQNRWGELSEIIKKDGSTIFNVLNNVDRNVFLDTELREPIEIGAFRALVKREKATYWFYLRLFFLAQLHLAASINKENNREVLMILRRPLILGALAYLVSELDQDESYVKWFTSVAESLYPNISLAELYENAVNFRKSDPFYYFNLIYEEANRYRHYYRYVINSIFDLPVDYEPPGSVPWGLPSTQTVKHPSKFIRKMASFRFSDMEKCYKGFIEWLKRREKSQKQELIGRLVVLLSKVKK